MSRLRPAATLIFALMLALTSGAMAVARGQAAATGTLVLCTGQGAVALPVDAQGRPVGPAHICPDGALALFVAQALPPVPFARPVAGVWTMAAPPAMRGHTGLSPAPYSARGPPAAI